MEIVYNKIKTKYSCHICGKNFNWNKDSVRYGKHEYKTIDEQKRIEKFFCSGECSAKFLNGDKKFEPKAKDN